MARFGAVSEPDTSLLYIADPMCSWCWGFAPILAEVEARLDRSVTLRFVMGGLAPDSTEPMSAETKEYVQRAWRAVAERTGARFNHEFWERCEPRRSTWPACRAVLAAESLRPGAGVPMFRAIQRAYYLEARDPSDPATLLDLASEAEPPFERAAYAARLASEEVRRRLAADFETRDRLGAGGFPTLGLFVPGRGFQVVTRGWAPLSEVLARLQALELS